MTQCVQESIALQGAGRRQVTGRFDGGRMSSDGGALLLREADKVLKVADRIGACFDDHRDPARTEHPVAALVSQRVFGLALGYEDLNDHDGIRSDSHLALVCGRDDLTGQQRARVRDREYPLAGSSTLNRMELGSPDTAGSHRYRKIAADRDKLDALLVDLFLDMYRKPRREIVIDLDATDDPVHGKQEGAQYHGYYRHYCFLPLYITCGDHVLGVRLRPSRIDASKGALEELERVVGRIRERWPEVEITVRGDSGFCRDRLMAWCEEHGARYVFGMARNPRLQRMIEEELEASKAECRDSGEASRRYREIRYRTLDSWSCERRVVGKPEWLPGPRGSNPRFVVSNIADDDIEARALYEDLYCARGDMENRIKEQQLDLFADRTPAHVMRANQLRAYFSAFAGAVMQVIRTFGLKGTELARAQAGTIRTRLLKIAGSIRVTTRRIRVSLSSLYPWHRLFRRVARNLAATVEQQLRPAPA